VTLHSRLLAEKLTKVTAERDELRAALERIHALENGGLRTAREIADYALAMFDKPPTTAKDAPEGTS
jgi:hypothetical protein